MPVISPGLFLIGIVVFAISLPLVILDANYSTRITRLGRPVLISGVSMICGAILLLMIGH